MQKLSPEVVYQLSHEYLDHAYMVARNVKTEEQLKQYYTLISMSIRALQHIKCVFPLSVDQDAKLTIELVELLLSETHSLDLAESYLSSMRERLNHVQISTTSGSLLPEKMRCEFLSLYTLPMNRNSKFHYRIAQRNCEELIQYLAELKNVGETNKVWLEIFQYVDVWLSSKLGKHSLAKAGFHDLSQKQGGSIQWQAFLRICHFNYLLDKRFPVPQVTLEQIKSIKCAEVGAKLFGWKLILELTLQIYEDKNISEKLSQFKEFFADNKDFLNDTSDSCVIEVGANISLSLKLPSVFQYKDMKNILLLIQSVSYLVNCYDVKANFSTRFLPKVLSTTKKLEKSVSEIENRSLHYYASKIHYYQSVLSLAEFYIIWEKLLLNSDFQILQSISTTSPYCPNLLGAMLSQIDEDKPDLEVCHDYLKITVSNTSSESKLIALLNIYVIRASLISRDIQREENLSHCNELWLHITKILRETDLQNNTTWDCTVTILWIMSHFEPFTSNPMPAGDEERSKHIEILRKYYSANKLLQTHSKASATTSDVEIGKGNAFKLKKSLLMQILLNYLGGRLLEQDLETICQISGICFRLAKQSNMLILCYITGLWHLTNCTVAMKNKEVTIITAKLDTIVSQINDKRHSD